MKEQRLLPSAPVLVTRGPTEGPGTRHHLLMHCLISEGLAPVSVLSASPVLFFLLLPTDETGSALAAVPHTFLRALVCL